MKVLRTKQIQEILGVKSQTLRVWVNTVPPFCSVELTPGKAKQYSAQDALFFLVVKTLVHDIGINISSISGYSQSLLNKCHSLPLGELARFQIVINPLNDDLYLSTDIDLKSPNCPVLLIPLDPLVCSIHGYLLGEERGTPTIPLPFPLRSVSNDE